MPICCFCQARSFRRHIHIANARDGRIEIRGLRVQICCNQIEPEAGSRERRPLGRSLLNAVRDQSSDMGSRHRHVKGGRSRLREEKAHRSGRILQVVLLDVHRLSRGFADSHRKTRRIITKEHNAIECAQRRSYCAAADCVEKLLLERLEFLLI